MEYGFLVHSAKGTTWSKKNHKYISKIGNRYVYRHKTGDINTGVYINKGNTKAMEYRTGEDGTSYFSGGKKARKTKAKLNWLERKKLHYSAKITNRIREIKGIKLSDYKIEKSSHDYLYDTAEFMKKALNKISGKNKKRRGNAA